MNIVKSIAKKFAIKEDEIKEIIAEYLRLSVLEIELNSRTNLIQFIKNIPKFIYNAHSGNNFVALITYEGNSYYVVYEVEGDLQGENWVRVAYLVEVYNMMGEKMSEKFKTEIEESVFDEIHDFNEYEGVNFSKYYTGVQCI